MASCPLNLEICQLLYFHLSRVVQQKHAGPIFPPNTFPLLSCFCPKPHLQGWWPFYCVCTLLSSSLLSLHELCWSFFQPLSQFIISSTTNLSIDSLDSVIMGFSFWVFSEFLSLFLILYWNFQSCTFWTLNPISL